MATEIAKISGRTVEQKLRQAWRRERRFHATRGICHLLLWLSGLVLADFLVDWCFLLPGYGRTLLLAINVATLAFVFYRSWWRHLRPYSPVRIALQVERRHPDLRSLLVSYVQFGDGGRHDEHMSPQLIEATRRLAMAATAPIDFREIIRWRDLRRAALFAGGVVLVSGALSVNWPEFLATLVHRLVDPTASGAYPTRTRITEIAGPVTVPEGSSVTLWARADGLVPASGTLSIKPQEGEWERLLMPQVEDTKFAYRFEQILRGFSYRVRLGDAVSETFEVRTVPSPHVVKTRARLHFPPYTKLPDKEVDTLHLEVPEGTKVSVDLTCDRLLRAAAVVREDGKAEPMRLGADGLTAAVEWDVKESFPFHFRWTERDHGFVYDGDVTYFVRVVADAPPEIELLAPAEDDKATVAKKLALRYRASDDYGVARAAVVYSVNNGPEQSRPLGTFDRATVEEESLWNLKETVAGLKEGDTLVFAVEVADNRAGEAGPNVARSRPLRLEIVSVPEYLRYMAEKRAKLFKELQALHAEETGAQREVKAMKDEPVPAAGGK